MKSTFLLVGVCVGWMSIGLAATAASPQEPPKSQTRLAVKDTSLTLNDRPAFLLGISYYGALGASEDAVRRDLAEIKDHGFGWIRVWATWAAFDNDVSAVAADGSPREPHLARLKWLLAECDRQGLVVDVTLSRGNGATGPARLQTQAAHRRAVETLVAALGPHRNWYLDLSNERNIRDRRFTSFEDLKELRALVRKLDPQRLVTASHAGDISRDELREYLLGVQVDFIAPHRPRGGKSPAETAAKTREYLAWMKQLGRVVPVHYQEPFRRGFSRGWEPTAEDFLTDLKQSRSGGAAGWCFHNGGQGDKPDGQPRRSFDLSRQRLFEQLDGEEQKLLREIRRAEKDDPHSPHERR